MILYALFGRDFMGKAGMEFTYSRFIIKNGECIERETGCRFDRPLTRAAALAQVNEWNRLSTLRIDAGHRAELVYIYVLEEVSLLGREQ